MFDYLFIYTHTFIISPRPYSPSKNSYLIATRAFFSLFLGIDLLMMSGIRILIKLNINESIS